MAINYNLQPISPQGLFTSQNLRQALGSQGGFGKIANSLDKRRAEEEALKARTIEQNRRQAFQAQQSKLNREASLQNNLNSIASDQALAQGAIDAKVKATNASNLYNESTALALSEANTLVNSIDGTKAGDRVVVNPKGTNKPYESYTDAEKAAFNNLAGSNDPNAYTYDAYVASVIAGNPKIRTPANISEQQRKFLINKVKIDRTLSSEEKARKISAFNAIPNSPVVRDSSLSSYLNSPSYRDKITLNQGLAGENSFNNTYGYNPQTGTFYDKSQIPGGESYNNFTQQVGEDFSRKLDAASPKFQQDVTKAGSRVDQTPEELLSTLTAQNSDVLSNGTRKQKIAINKAINSRVAAARKKESDLTATRIKVLQEADKQATKFKNELEMVQFKATLDKLATDEARSAALHDKYTLANADAVLGAGTYEEWLKENGLVDPIPKRK